MQLTKFGRTGMSVSRLCLGTATFGKQTDEAESHCILDAAADAGINLLDTADFYPMGAAHAQLGSTEEITGRWLKGKRHRFIVASKAGAPMSPLPWDQGGSRKHLLDAIDASLRRLGTDYVDLYQLHWDDPTTPLDETLEAFDTIVRSGKARYIGISNILAYRLARSLGRSDVLRVARYVSVQPRYNLLFREIERELLPLAQEEPGGYSLQSPRRRAADRQIQPRQSARQGPLFAGNRQVRGSLSGALLASTPIRDRRTTARHRKRARQAARNTSRSHGCWRTPPLPP